MCLEFAARYLASILLNQMSHIWFDRAGSGDPQNSLEMDISQCGSVNLLKFIVENTFSQNNVLLN